MKTEEHHLKFRDINPISFITYFNRNWSKIFKEFYSKEAGASHGATDRHSFLAAYNILSGVR